MKYALIILITLPLLWGRFNQPEGITTSDGAFLAVPSVNMVATVADRAFPEAVGSGASALVACRNGVLNSGWNLKIWRVTSLVETNPASFGSIVKDSLILPAYQDNTYNIVLILVDGLHEMTNGWTVAPHCTYIAGQVSQGGGFAHAYGTWNFGKYQNKIPQDLVMRFMTSTNVGNFTMNGLRVYQDHMTTRWSASGGGQHNVNWGLDSATYPGLYTRFWTQAYGINYEPRTDHPTAWGTGGSPRDAPDTGQGTAWRNAVLGTGYRYPNTQTDTLTLAQNILYNWAQRATGIGGQSIVNLMGNFHHTGPATQSGGIKHMPYLSHESCGRIADDDFATGSDSVCTRKIYLAYPWYLSEVGNADTLLPTDTRDYWRGADSIIVCRDFTNSQYGWINERPTYPADGWCAAHGEKVPLHHKASAFQRHTPDWVYPPDTTGLTRAKVDSILADVGNSRRVDCEGYWTRANRRDMFDSSRVAWFINNLDNNGGFKGLGNITILGGADRAYSGVYVQSNPDAVGGEEISEAEYTPVSAAQCADTDLDGLPNAFESLCTGSATAMTASGDLSGDGWLNIEEYINGTNQTRKLAWNDNSVGEDGFKIWRDTGSGFTLLATVGANVTTYTDYDSRVGYRYNVVAYQGLSSSPQSNIITSTCN